MTEHVCEDILRENEGFQAIESSYKVEIEFFIPQQFWLFKIRGATYSPPVIVKFCPFCGQGLEN